MAATTAAVWLGAPGRRRLQYNQAVLSYCYIQTQSNTTPGNWTAYCHFQMSPEIVLIP